VKISGRFFVGVFSLSFLCACSGADSGDADSRTVIRCGADNTSEQIIFVYSGGAEGKLTVFAPFGDLELKASKSKRGDGIFGIRAFGAGESTMVPRASLESCVASGMRSRGFDGNTMDEDVATLVANQCHSSLGSEAAALTVDVTVEIAVIDAPEATVSITRNYVGDTPDYLAAVSFPPLNCDVTESGS
jgi:hypothetical protein